MTCPLCSKPTPDALAGHPCATCWQAITSEQRAPWIYQLIFAPVPALEFRIPLNGSATGRALLAFLRVRS